MSLRIVVVDADARRVARLPLPMKNADCEMVLTLQDIAGIEAHLRRCQPDAVIVFRDVPDQDLLTQLSVLMREQPLPIVVFAEDSDSETTRRAIQAGVSAYIVAGWEPTRLRPILDAARERFRQLEGLRGELAATRNQLAELRRIERAKGILMRTRGLSEDQAYEALRKQASDGNKRLEDVAENVIVASKLVG